MKAATEKAYSELSAGVLKRRAFMKNRAAVVGFFLVAVMTIIAVAAPLLAPCDIRAQNPAAKFLGPTEKHLLGTDDLGRDTLSRTMFGARISLLVGVASVLMATVLGTMVGMVSAYVGGKFDSLVMGLVDIMMTFPTILLCLTILMIMGSGLLPMILAIGFSLFPRFIRIARGSTLSVKEAQYVEAARLVGRSDLKIIFLHLLPNITGPIIVIGTLWIATAIRIEASLSFLGFGVNPPTPTWGNMIKEGLTYMTLDPWLVLIPGAAIMVTIVGFNMLGDGLRDVSDPRLRG